MKAIYLSLSIMGLLFFSCGTVRDDIYLMDVNIQAPIVTSPLGFVDSADRQFVFIPKVILNNNSDILSGVNAFTPDSTSTKHFRDFNKNIDWDISGTLFGFDAELPISKTGSVVAGINYYSGKNQLTSYSFGFSFGKGSDNIGFRFDFGGIWQQHYYSANSILIRSYSWDEKKDTLYFRDTETTLNFNSYASFILHTYDYFINPFIQGSFVNQKYLSILPTNIVIGVGYDRNDTRRDESQFFFSATPGFYIDLNKMLRLVFSARIIFSNSLNENLLIAPALNINLSL